MHTINNCTPADWLSGFESKLSVDSSLPYDEFTSPIETSGSDKRQYRLVRLPNNLFALCVQDDKAAAAAVSLSIGIGSNASPVELHGLAHFLVNMLFLGTTKYPSETEYDTYLSNNSGKCNAYTDYTEANYYFSISNAALEGAVDRFAQFFISPLFNADCVDRELKVVDSEYKGSVQRDAQRIIQLVARTSNPAHPYSLFNIGNTQTLRDAAKDLGLDLREELIKFHDRYYSADIMRLVVVGNYSLDALTELVVSKFSDIKSKGDTRPKLDCAPIRKAELGKLIRYKTVSEKYELKLRFALPEIKSLYREKPFEYISALLEHKEPGSIYSVLRKNGWATGISAGSSARYHDGFGTYSIDIAATPEGLENYEAIVSIVFGYINMLIEHGPQEWYYEELSLISKAKFDYKDKEDAETYARTISKGAHNQYVTPHHILSHEALMNGYDAELISKCLSYLNPGNYRLFVGAQEHKSVECTLEEKHYNILHHISDLPLHMTSSVNCSSSVAKMLHLPGRNAFLPDNFSVSKAAIVTNPPSLEPVLLRKNDRIEAWFRQDNQFLTPHGTIGLTISSQSVDDSPTSWVLSSLLCKLVSAELEEQLFSAKMANSRFSISLGIGSIDVEVSGFSSGLPILLTTVLKKLKSFKVDKQQFFVYLSEIERENIGKCQENLMQRLYAQVNIVNLMPAHDSYMLEKAIKSVTLDQLQTHIKLLFGKAYVKMLVSGNYTLEVALDTSAQVLDTLQLQATPKYSVNTRRTLNIEPGYFVHNVPISDQKCLNSAVVSVFYCGSVNNARDAIIIRALKSLVHAALFSQLRTSEQLGYRVGAVLNPPKGGRDMLMFVVEGESSPAYATQRINSFIRDYRHKLQELATEEFESLSQSQINLKQGKPKSIDDEFSRLWTHIKSGQYRFGALDDDIEHLKQLRMEDLLSFWDKYINEDTAPGYTRMDMQMWSSKIWQPTAEEFEMYPSAIIALYGCLRSSGYTEFGIADIHSFVLAAAALGNSDIDSLLTELNSLYSRKQGKAKEPTYVAVDSVEAPKVVFGSSSKIATALKMAVSSANDKAKFKALCKTNFAAIDMKQSPEGIWLLNDYTQFKSTQALHGLPVPARKFAPIVSKPAQVENTQPSDVLHGTPQPSTKKPADAPKSKSTVYDVLCGRFGLWRQAWRKGDQSAASNSSK